jgi:hypothetical protein
VIAEREFDVLIAGPLSRVGMDAAGTLQEVRDFMRLVDEVRRASGRLVATILIHHENAAGRVSGAWEGATDTLIHVTGQGHGSTRVYVQKARWASAYHTQTLQLVWTPGDGFALNEQSEVTEQDIETQLISAVKAKPGVAWTPIEKQIKGVSNDVKRRVRDRLLREGVIVNIAKAAGRDVWLEECPERRPSSLYMVDDPTIQSLRPDSGAGGAQTVLGQPVGDHLAPAPCAPPYKGRTAVGAATPAQKSARRRTPDEVFEAARRLGFPSVVGIDSTGEDWARLKSRVGLPGVPDPDRVWNALDSHGDGGDSR